MAEVIPYRPIPPVGSTYVMAIPPAGPDGVRQTVNTGLDENETIWNLRSAWNVAALNCLGDPYKPILDGYSMFLKKNAKKLTAVNAAIDKKYRISAGSVAAGRAAREAHMTQVYNYFATPAAIGEMCPVALAVSNEWLQAQPKDVAEFARAALPRFEAVYLAFFDAYDRYRADSAAWDAKYGAQYGYSQPGYVAVHGGAGQTIGATLAGSGAPALAGEVVDPDTGAKIPVVNLPASTASTPVVQPVAKDQPGSGK
ncbi:MAG: hypothetical protein J2O44_05290 [Porphyrobacter sp.]|nr:hypothetical protein [Porphyrobacter sp.]